MNSHLGPQHAHARFIASFSRASRVVVIIFKVILGERRIGVAVLVTHVQTTC